MNGEVLGLPGQLWQSLGLTLKLAALTAAILGAGGIPLAHWLNRSRWRFAPAVETLVTLPIVLPPTVIGFYLLLVFSPNHPRELVAGRDGFDPRLFIPGPGHRLGRLFSAIRRPALPGGPARRARRACSTPAPALGAPPWRVWCRLYLPLAWRGVAAGLDARLRPHPRRVRRGPDDRRLDSRRDEGGEHRPLRRGSGAQLQDRRTNLPPCCSASRSPSCSRPICSRARGTRFP